MNQKWLKALWNEEDNPCQTVTKFSKCNPPLRTHHHQLWCVCPTQSLLPHSMLNCPCIAVQCFTNELICKLNFCTWQLMCKFRWELISCYFNWQLDVGLIFPATKAPSVSTLNKPWRASGGHWVCHPKDAHSKSLTMLLVLKHFKPLTE